MEVMEAIRARRSIRKYKPDPVDDSKLSLVLDAARLAPSWENTQCWRFVVVSDAALKGELADAINPTNPARESVRGAPVVIVACAELKKSGYTDGEATTDKGDWCLYDIGVAMEHLVLAAQSVGLATVHVGKFDAGKAAAILRVPEGFCVVAMTPLGYPDQVRNARPRKELAEIVFYNRFGAER